MVRTLITYFAPQINLGRRYNNSSLVRDLIFDECQDITFKELDVNWQKSEKVMKRIHMEFDVIIAFGEYDINTAQIETKAQKDKIISNTITFPRFDYIYINKKYDLNNDYTCNDLNYFLLENNIHSVFVHVPVQRLQNDNIKLNVMQLVEFMLKTYEGVHKVAAKIETIFTRGYTDVKENSTDAACKRGIYFPFNEWDDHNMTMERTQIDLDLIFLDDRNKILVIKKGVKYKKKPIHHWSFSVLEVRHPYCELNLVKSGQIINILDETKLTLKQKRKKTTTQKRRRFYRVSRKRISQKKKKKKK